MDRRCIFVLASMQKAVEGTFESELHCSNLIGLFLDSCLDICNLMHCRQACWQHHHTFLDELCLNNAVSARTREKRAYQTSTHTLNSHTHSEPKPNSVYSFNTHSPHTSRALGGVGRVDTFMTVLTRNDRVSGFYAHACVLVSEWWGRHQVLSVCRASVNTRTLHRQHQRHKDISKMHKTYTARLGQDPYRAPHQRTIYENKRSRSTYYTPYQPTLWHLWVE